MEIPECFEDGLLFPWLSELSFNASQMRHLTTSEHYSQRSAWQEGLVHFHWSAEWRSYEDASALLMRECCVITASLCRTACWDSTIVCVKELQLRFLHGQRPRASRLWNCCSGLFIVMHALLFTINIQLSCPPTKYLIYGCERVCEECFVLMFTLLQVPKKCLSAKSFNENVFWYSRLFWLLSNHFCHLKLSSFHPLLLYCI